jgi:hypothetical protein
MTLSEQSLFLLPFIMLFMHYDLVHFALQRICTFISSTALDGAVNNCYLFYVT